MKQNVLKGAILGLSLILNLANCSTPHPSSTIAQHHSVQKNSSGSSFWSRRGTLKTLLGACLVIPALFQSTPVVAQTATTPAPTFFDFSDLYLTPVPTEMPTEMPTPAPSEPTGAPTMLPTTGPSTIPTNNPTLVPTVNPSQVPSQAPTPPTANPSQSPTVEEAAFVVMGNNATSIINTTLVGDSDDNDKKARGDWWNKGYYNTNKNDWGESGWKGTWPYLFPIVLFVLTGISATCKLCGLKYCYKLRKNNNNKCKYCNWYLDCNMWCCKCCHCAKCLNKSCCPKSCNIFELEVGGSDAEKLKNAIEITEKAEGGETIPNIKNSLKANFALDEVQYTDV